MKPHGLPLVVALLAAVLAGSAEARTCPPAVVGPFAERARWGLNRVLIVRVLGYRVVDLYSHRVSFRMDVQVVEDLNGAELRPRVRVLSLDPLLFDDDGEEFAKGTLWALALEPPPAYWFREYGELWGPDASPIDYFLGCGSAAEPLDSLADAERGPVGEVKAFWRARLGQGR